MMFEERIYKMNGNENASPNHSPSFKKRKSDSKKGSGKNHKKQNSSDPSSSPNEQSLFDRCLMWISCRYRRKGEGDENG